MRIKKEAVREVIRNYLFEIGSSSLANTNYGIYDQPGPSWDGDKVPEEDITVQAEVPLTPTEMMSNQLVDERPPIEDDEYAPSNPEELSRAARAIAQLVPGGQVDFFYKNLHRLLDKSTDKENNPNLSSNNISKTEEEDSAPVEAEKSEEKNESTIRKNIRTILEQPEFEESPEELASYRYGSEMPADDGEFEEAANAAVSLPSTQEGMTFEELASQFGFSGVPGVRQYIDRITSRMEYFVSKTDPKEIQMLQDRAVDEYIDLMISTELIDDEDAVELQQSPAIVKDLDSFRFFFVSGFVLPAFQQLGRDAGKRVKSELSSIGLPEKMHQTVLNQVTGKAARDRSAISRKLSAAANETGMSTEEKLALSKRLAKIFPSLHKLAELDQDMVKLGLDKWSSFNQKKKEDLLRQALNSTADFQQQFQN